MRKYAIWITDSDNQDHLYSIVEGSLYEVYLQWIEPYESCEGDVWIDEVLVGEESPSFLYAVWITYPIPLIQFGNTMPIKLGYERKHIGTYGQLEVAFRHKYENASETLGWWFEVDEIPRDS
jgi:hypothetical protein